MVLGSKLRHHRVNREPSIELEGNLDMIRVVEDSSAVTMKSWWQGAQELKDHCPPTLWNKMHLSGKEKV
jgi:hypothetical protein